jgi:hypothetical protein
MTRLSQNAKRSKNHITLPLEPTVCKISLRQFGGEVGQSSPTISIHKIDRAAFDLKRIVNLRLMRPLSVQEKYEFCG